VPTDSFATPQTFAATYFTLAGAISLQGSITSLVPQASYPS